jgi:hypothetical protein
VYSVILSDSAQDTSALPAVGTVVTDANFNAGAVVICDMGMRRLDASTSGANFTALAATDKFFIVQGKGTGVPLMKSPALTKGNISITTSKFKSAVQQVTYVGYNGTSGSLTASNTTRYWIKVRKRDNDAANRSQPMSLFAGPILTDSSASQSEVAFLLARSAVKNFSQEPANGYLKVEVVSDGTKNAIGTATLAATYGSTLLTYSAAHSLAVDDLVYIGEASGTGGTYQVKTVVSTTKVILSIPFAGTTVTALATGTTTSTHSKLTATANFGIRLTGVVAPFNVNSFRDYYANRFTVTYSDTTVPVKSTGASDGTGVWQKVAMDEYMSYGFEGQNNQLAVPSIARDQVVKIPGVAGNTAQSSRYSAFMISWEETMQGIVSRDGGKGSVIVYCNLTNVPTGLVTTTTAEEMVNTILSSTTSPTAAATLTILNMP